MWIGGNNCPTNGQPRLKPVADDQILKFTTDGKFVMQIGHSNQSKGNADTQNLHRPSDASYYAPTNEMFVSDGYGNHRVVVFDARYRRVQADVGRLRQQARGRRSLRPGSPLRPAQDRLHVSRTAAVQRRALGARLQ